MHFEDSLVAVSERDESFDCIDPLPLDIALGFINNLLHIDSVPSPFRRVFHKSIIHSFALLIRVSVINVIIRRGLRKLLWYTPDIRRCSVLLATLIDYSIPDTVPGNS